MKTPLATDTPLCVIPPQTLSGSRGEMLSTIDQAITGLLALRHLIAGEALVLPTTIGAQTAPPDQRDASAPVARVGRVFSSLMRRHRRGLTPHE